MTANEPPIIRILYHRMPPTNARFAQCLAISAVLLISLTAAFAQQHPASPAASSPNSLPAGLPPGLAHDQHENFAVAVAFCADETCSRQIFGKQNPVQGGILSVDVYLRNDGDEPLLVALDDIQLDIRPAPRQPDPDSDSGDLPGPENRTQELASLSPTDAAQRILYPTGSGQPKAPGAPPSPLDWFHSDKNVAKLAAKLQPFAFTADSIEPHSTVHGYLFFDVGGDFAVISRASLYVPNIRARNGGRHLSYFEVSLVASHPH